MRKRVRKSQHEISGIVERILIEKRYAGFRELHRLVSDRVGKEPSFQILYKALKLVPHLRIKPIPSRTRPKTGYYLDIHGIINNKLRELEALLRTRRADLSSSEFRDIRNKLERLKIFIPE